MGYEDRSEACSDIMASMARIRVVINAMAQSLQAAIIDLAEDAMLSQSQAMWIRNIVDDACEGAEDEIKKIETTMDILIYGSYDLPQPGDDNVPIPE